MESILNFDSQMACDLVLKEKYRNSFQIRQVLRKVKRLAKHRETTFYCDKHLKEETIRQLRLRGFEVEIAQLYFCVIRWNNKKQGE